ncbi:sperm microtubule inner protein 8 [Phyllobates terribilis]|uniref:sperm microtubule inner protein 8 n=1 Tax=Phyllobates terribilis TaxID=111132 RepID=UPI003CCA8BC3
MSASQHPHCCGLDRSSPVYHLAGVKHSLYHPRLPTLRRMEMDSVGSKLSDEHSRSSTPCDHGSFRSPWISSSDLEKCPLPSLEITDTGRRLTQRRVDRNMAPNLQGWIEEKEVQRIQYSTKCTEAAGSFQLPDLRGMDLGFRGSAVRFLSPHVPHSWGFCLEQNPSVDDHGQKPVPVETMNTFRSFVPTFR